MTEVISYQEVKDIALGMFWIGCQHNVDRNCRWTPAQVFGWTYGELEMAFDEPVENLMLEVILFVLARGIQDASNAGEWHRSSAAKILAGISLEVEFARLNPDDVAELKRDLKALGLVVD
ncbi:hypothetical protein [Stenotrophomonas sp. HMWF023]|uniref:hypothetical protein n=1 Tax=Stenotrophomonas sp. HMWF023 TaxID=2056859 RepID=UPI0011B1E31A|nr:hypothetical protein [Stenotrophomonas sp. HMWF023]